MGLSLRMFTGDAARGLERGLDSLRIDKEHLEFEGKILRLEEDEAVTRILGSTFDKGHRHYDVRLGRDLTRGEILALIRKYGFPEPTHIIENPNKTANCVEFLYNSFFHPSQRVFFYQPNHNGAI